MSPTETKEERYRRYADSHKSPDGPGDARPDALEVVKDEDKVGKLDGKVILITGASSGIGRLRADVYTCRLL